MESGADSRRPTADNLCYQFCHSLRFLAGILLDGLDNRAAHHGSVGKVANRRKMGRTGDAETHGDRQLRKLAQALDQSLGVLCQVFARARYTCARDRINEASRHPASSLETIVGAGGRGKEDRGQIAFSHAFQILAGFFNRKIERVLNLGTPVPGPLPQDAATLTFTVPLPIETEKETDLTAEQIRDRLERYVTSREFLQLTFQDRTYRVYCASVQTASIAPKDANGALSLVVIQINTGDPTLLGEVL